MIRLIEEKPDVDTYLSLRRAVHFHHLSREQAGKALDNSLYILVAYQDEKPVGMGRIVGDGAVIFYVQDLIILPGVQGQGIGGRILEALKEYVIRTGYPDTMAMLDLMCAKGRERFYGKHGFIARPTDTLGPGMIMYLNI